VQKALDEGRLKFGEKTKQPMQVDVDHLKKADSMYAEVVGINMVDIVEEFDSSGPYQKVKILSAIRGGSLNILQQTPYGVEVWSCMQHLLRTPEYTKHGVTMIP